MTDDLRVVHDVLESHLDDFSAFVRAVRARMTKAQ